MSTIGTTTSISGARRSGRWLATVVLAAAIAAPGCAASAAVPEQAGAPGTTRTAESFARLAGPATTAAPVLDGTPAAAAAGTGVLAATLRSPRAVDLQVPGERSNAQYVSESGVVAGVTTTEEDSYVFRWKAGRTAVLDIPSTTVDARGVNASGQVLVNTYERGLSTVLLWEPDGTVTQVSEPGVWSQATDLNDAGQVSGIIGTDDGQQRAVVWRDGQTTDLGDLGVGYVYASAINNVGQVVGTASRPDAPDAPFVWKDGVMTPLPLPAGVTGGVAWNVNERGDVLGEVTGDTLPAGGQASVWDRGTGLRYLGDPGAHPNDLNGRGLAVGAAERGAAGALVPASMDRTGVSTLRTPQGTAGEARAVNDMGTTVGYARAGEGWQALAWIFGVPAVLAPPPGVAEGASSWAVDVNRRGLVAGSVTVPTATGGSTDRAVVWDIASTTRKIEQGQTQ